MPSNQNTTYSPREWRFPRHRMPVQDLQTKVLYKKKRRVQERVFRRSPFSVNSSSWLSFIKLSTKLFEQEQRLLSSRMPFTVSSTLQTSIGGISYFLSRIASSMTPLFPSPIKSGATSSSWIAQQSTSETGRGVSSFWAKSMTTPEKSLRAGPFTDVRLEWW